MKLAVVGAGWAGLSAAVTLKSFGADVTVFEAAPITGGRARRVDDTQMGAIDNGQHLLLGAYTETLALMQILHPQQSTHEFIVRQALHLESAGGAFRLRAPALIAPFHTLAGLLNAKGLTWQDRWRALSMMLALKRNHWQALPMTSVAQLLNQHQQSARICQYLWTPLCLASLNTATAEACAQLFLNVLRDSLDAPRAHSDMLIPKVDLTTLWPQAAADTVTMRYRHIVREITPTAAAVIIDGEGFEGCILATPPYACARILKPEAPTEQSDQLLRQLNAFCYRAIATLTLQLDSNWELPQPIMLLDEDAARGHLGQWVFKRPQTSDQFSVVISDAEDFLKHDRAQFIERIGAQIREQTQRHPSLRHTRHGSMPAIKTHRLIVEKRATFAAVPGLQRPTNQSPWPRLSLAGDWTDTGYPAVLEGAVRSGKQAAQILMTNLTPAA
ncbi:MAG: hydroxysqualene dehydroxylase HpnE [Alcaligenaceae bacterium]